MTGTWFCSLCFLLCAGLGAAPPQGDGVNASARSHELQLRNNNYANVPDQLLLQGAGISKVIVRVFSDDEKNGGLYFTNRDYKTVRPMLDNWAPNFYNGKVGLWAWMGGRWFSWLKDSRYLDREWQNNEQRIIPKLDLFNPDAEELIIDLFKQLAGKPIQGILIQDDLVLRHSEGLSNWGKACFTVATGFPADERLMTKTNSAPGQAWERVKCERLTRVLAKIITACKTVNPLIKVAMNIHYELPLAPEQARSWYAHDPEALAASSLDHFYLMAYHRQIKSELNLSEAANRLYFAKMTAAALERFGPRLVVKIQVRDWQDSSLIPFSELKTYYDLIPAGIERVCFAAADPEDIPLIAQIISQAPR
jgi:biofilm PGA synthesis lipoprotein PgaB